MAIVEHLTELQHHADEDPLYPARLYVYDANGRYSSPTVLNNEAEFTAALAGPVLEAVNEGREVRITDPGDMLVFHARDGAVVFPTPEDCRTANGGAA